MRCSAIALSPQQICAWRRASGLPVAEVSAPEALFVPAVVAAPVSEPAGKVAAETAETPPDIVPAQLRVIVVRRPKYACRASEDVVVQAPAPAQMIEGGPPTQGDGRAGAGEQICRPPVDVSRNADLLPTGLESGSLDLGRLGRPRHRAFASGDKGR